jgi:hypothetical protein
VTSDSPRPWPASRQIPSESYTAFQRIRDKATGRIIPFSLRPEQRKLSRAKAEAILAGKLRRFLIVKFRQWGCTTQEVCANDFLTGTFKGQYAVTMAHDLPTTMVLFQMATRLYEHHSTADMCIPGTKQPLFHWKRATQNRRELYYPDADSRYFIGTAGNRSFGHGMTINRLHLSEASRYPSLSDVLTSAEGVPTESGEITIESTPFGATGEFYDLAQEAHLGQNEWTLIFFRWFEFGMYRLPVTPDEAKQIAAEVATGSHPRYGNEEKALGQALAREGIVLDAGMWKWRRMKRASLKDRFFEQYPEDFVSCWLASGRSLFDQQLLRETGLRLGDNQAISKHEGETLWIYEDPLPGRDYVLWADPAEGIERGTEDGEANGSTVASANAGKTDYTAWGILDRETNEDVAVSLSRITVDELARQIDRWGRAYNNALAVVERNNHGHAVIALLERDESRYPNVFVSPEDDRAGWHTSSANRTPMLDALDLSFRDGDFVPVDPRMREQMKTFIITAKGRAEAAPLKHDDLVTGRAIGNQVRQMPRTYTMSGLL